MRFGESRTEGLDSGPFLRFGAFGKNGRLDRIAVRGVQKYDDSDILINGGVLPMNCIGNL